MPIDITPLITPERTAVLVSECQEAVLGEHSSLPGLAASARELGLADTIAGLLARAREHDVTIVHCLLERTGNDSETSANTPITAMMAREHGKGAGMTAGSPGAQPVAALRPLACDLVARRADGLTAFHETELDALLCERNIEAVIFTGVSLNLAITGGAVEAANRGYRVVIATDCVAAAPAEYAQQLLDHTLRNIAYLSTSRDIIAAWDS